MLSYVLVIIDSHVTSRDSETQCYLNEKKISIVLEEMTKQSLKYQVSEVYLTKPKFRRMHRLRAKLK